MTFKKFTDELRVYFYAHLYYKDLFLYNYVARLNVVGDYMASQQIARKSSDPSDRDYAFRDKYPGIEHSIYYNYGFWTY